MRSVNDALLLFLQMCFWSSASSSLLSQSLFSLHSSFSTHTTAGSRGHEEPEEGGGAHPRARGEQPGGQQAGSGAGASARSTSAFGWRQHGARGEGRRCFGLAATTFSFYPLSPFFISSMFSCVRVSNSSFPPEEIKSVATNLSQAERKSGRIRKKKKERKNEVCELGREAMTIGGGWEGREGP